jgi:hypothetical protein
MVVRVLARGAVELAVAALAFTAPESVAWLRTAAAVRKRVVLK